MVNIYDQTKCPRCKAPNNVYRPWSTLRSLPAWNEVTCVECGHKYYHDTAERIINDPAKNKPKDRQIT